MPTARCGFDDLPALGLSGREFLISSGPTLPVFIGFDAAYEQTKIGLPAIPQDPLNALVDTGATESCIDVTVADRLQLPKINRRKIGGVGGAHEVDFFLAHVHIPHVQLTLHGAFAGVQLVAGGQSHFALLGRTFLQRFTMTYEGKTGTVTLDW